MVITIPKLGSSFVDVILFFLPVISFLLLLSTSLFLVWDRTPLELYFVKTGQTVSCYFPCLEPRKIGTILLHFYNLSFRFVNASHKVEQF